jgi:hypothetical protein
VNDSEKPRKSLFSVTEDGDIEFELSKQSSTPPTPGKKLESLTTTIKGWGALVAAVGALVAGITSLYKPVPVDTTVSKAAYDALAKDVKELSEQNARTHDDIVILRAYLDGALHTLGYAQEPVPRPISPMSLASAAASSLTPGRPQAAATSPAWRPPTAKGLPPMQPKVPDPPVISERPRPVAPAPWESVVASAKTPPGPPPK